jgi:hypothetical protein
MTSLIVSAFIYETGCTRKENQLSTIWYEFMQKQIKRKTKFKAKVNSYNSRYRGECSSTAGAK